MTTAALRRTAIAGGTTLLLLNAAVTLRAQDPTGHVAIEAVASGSVSSADDGDPFLIFDQTSTIGVGRGWDVVVRPWARRMPGGDWAAEMYQLQVRYTSSTRIPVRLDAGIICSPIGLSTLELRPDVNPTIGAPFYYFVPLPAFDGNFDRVTLMSGGYPLGALVSASGSHPRRRSSSRNARSSVPAPSSVRCPTSSRSTRRQRCSSSGSSATPCTPCSCATRA